MRRRRHIFGGDTRVEPRGAFAAPAWNPSLGASRLTPNDLVPGSQGEGETDRDRTVLNFTPTSLWTDEDSVECQINGGIQIGELNRAIGRSREALTFHPANRKERGGTLESIGGARNAGEADDGLATGIEGDTEGGRSGQDAVGDDPGLAENRAADIHAGEITGNRA